MTIPLFRPYFSESLRRSIAADLDEILSNGQLMLGPFSDKLERLFAQVVGVPYAVSVNSGTTALTICLEYFNVAHREVLVPSGSFITSVSSIIFAGGTPVLVDMNPDTLSFDLDDLEEKLTPKTAGIIWVHLTGFISPEYEQIITLAKDKGLFLLEDCAHALGAVVDGREAGSLGDAGCYSFYPTKIITSGTGGMIATDDGALKKYAEQMRLFGKDAEKGEVTHLGNDWFLDEIRACIAYHQLVDLESILARRLAIANRYRKSLDNQHGFAMLNVPEGNLPTYYQFPLFLDRRVDTEKLIGNLMSKYQIQAKRIYQPTHLEPVFREYDDKTLLKTQDTLNRSLCLPLYAQMTDEDIFHVANSLLKELRSLA